MDKPNVGGGAPSPRDATATTGGTLLIFERPPPFPLTNLLDLALPWVLACWTLAGLELPEAEAFLPLLLPAHPGWVRARLRSLGVVAAFETRQAIDLADQLPPSGLTLLQFDRRPPDDLPDDFRTRPVPEQVELAASCGVKLMITDDRECVIATAFNDETFARLRTRYAQIPGCADEPVDQPIRRRA